MILRTLTAKWKVYRATVQTRRNLKRARLLETDWNPRGEAWRRFNAAMVIRGQRHGD